MSLFNEVKKFFSAQENLNREITSKEFCNAMSGHEVSTFWKRMNSPFYRSYTYRCYLKRLGLVKQVRHGVWETVAPVPEWLNSGVTNFLLGYHNWEKRNNTHYDGLTKDEWMSKLESHIRLYKAAQEHKLRADIKEFMERPLEVKRETEDSEYVYIVSMSDSLCVCWNKEDAIKKAIEIICSRREMVTITKNKKGEWFYYNTFTLAGAGEVITIDAKDLAREIVGDGKLNNIWFVTSGPYMLERTDHYESDFVLMDGYTDSDSECFGPFFSYEDACAKYDDIELDHYDGIGQVFIEDRLIGVVKEKFIEKIMVVDYSYNEHDDSGFYKRK
jgi:hypothetical protein